jgi:hypothetical protein
MVRGGAKPVEDGIWTTRRCVPLNVYLFVNFIDYIKIYCYMKHNSIFVIEILCLGKLLSCNTCRCSADSWFGVQTANRN